MSRLTKVFHHLLFPKDSNNFKSKAVQLDFLTFYLVFALIFTVAVKQFKAGAVLGFATDITVDKLYQLTNDERAKNSLPPLTYNSQLAAAAYNKAENMFSHNYWAHFAPDGTTPWSFILGSGYQYSVAGENLAKGFYFSDSVVNAWMNSPSHRENILRNAYQDVGFAVVNGTLDGQETTLVVQMFGAPLSSALPANTQQHPVQAATIPTVASTVAPTVPATTHPTVPVTIQNPVQKTYYQPSSAVLAKTQDRPLLNVFPAYFDVNILFLLFVSAALVFDFYFTNRLNILRVSGKNLAHLLFIGFMFIGIMVISKGGIIQ